MIKKAEEADINEIYEISSQFFDWKIEQLKESLSPNNIFLLKKQNGQTAGFLLAQNLVDSINILLIATKKEFQKQGIASLLLKELEKIASSNCQKIWLEVKEDNQPAINFYQNHGFKFLTKRKHYYSTGQDALIYEKSAF